MLIALPVFCGFGLAAGKLVRFGVGFLVGSIEWLIGRRSTLNSVNVFCGARAHEQFLFSLVRLCNSYQEESHCRSTYHNRHARTP